MKNAPEGYVFERTITDDTMLGGPIERMIRYYAPFDGLSQDGASLLEQLAKKIHWNKVWSGNPKQKKLELNDVPCASYS